MTETLVKIEDLHAGEPFRKRTGTYVYIKISDDALRYMGVDYTSHVWGFGFNGNVTKVERGTKVKPVSLRDAYGNLVDWDNWEESMGCDTRSVR